MPQNLQQATRAAIMAENLEALDSLGSFESEFQSPNSAIEAACGRFIERVHQNLEDETMVVTGAASDITLEETNEGINILANPHLIYQDKGVNGSRNKLYDTPFAFNSKRPPVQAFIDYIENKNITLRNNETYYGAASPFRNLSDEQQKINAAYAMRESVFQNGMRPRNVYSKEIEQLANDVAENIAGFTVENIFEQLR